MGIANFGSLFELFAAINIAFVAVDYANNYTNILAKKVFNLENIIKVKFDEFHTVFSNRISLSTITKLQINNQSADRRIEDCKRNQEKLEKEVNENKEALISSIDEECRFSSFSDQCLWSFLYCVSALFFAGLETSNNGSSFANSLIFLSIFTVIYFVIGWFGGECKNKIFRKFFCGLLSVIIIFGFSLCISLILSFYLLDLCNTMQQWFCYLIPIAASMPLLNFIIYFVVSLSRINKIKNDLNTKSKDIQAKCDKWGTAADELINAHNLGNSLEQQ